MRTIYNYIASINILLSVVSFVTDSSFVYHLFGISLLVFSLLVIINMFKNKETVK